MARIIGGRYRLDEELASGGFGTVWQAWDQVLHVEVAVKQMRLDPSASDAARDTGLCLSQAPAWTTTDTAHVVLATGGKPAFVRCLRPR